MKRSKINWKRIERVAVKYESSGFGKVNPDGLTWHDFSPDGLKRFVLAISKNQPIRSRKKRALRKKK